MTVDSNFNRVVNPIATDIPDIVSQLEQINIPWFLRSVIDLANNFYSILVDNGNLLSAAKADNMPLLFYHSGV